MSKLNKLIEERIKEVQGIEQKQNEELRPVSTRMSIDEIEKLGNVASVLDMSKSEFIRFVVSNAVDDIIEKYNMSFETIGMTHVEADEFIEKLNSGEYELVDKKVNDND